MGAGARRRPGRVGAIAVARMVGAPAALSPHLVGVPPVIAHQVEAAVGDVLGDRRQEIRRLEGDEIGPGNGACWEEYARATFLAHAKNVPPATLRFLQYVRKGTLGWWREQESKGAVLLGKASI